MSQSLCLFTTYYPYGKFEVYIDNELPYLAEAFDKVYIFPSQPKGELRELPPNVEVVMGFENTPRNNWALLGRNLGGVLRVLGGDLLSKGPFVARLKRLRFTFGSLMAEVHRAERMKTWLAARPDTDFVFYSNWFVGWATALSWLKMTRVIECFVCRAHGYDLYIERRPEGFIPFRIWQLKSVLKVFSISRFGHDYLRSQYPRFKEKIQLSYLGVQEKGINPFDPAATFTLVSCSNFAPVKRMHLIVEVLKYVDFPLRWIHFGNGPLEAEITQLAQSLPKHIQYEFPGRITNAELMDRYTTMPIHAFINLSESEGLPVSIMEVISFGIPVVATNVGGTAEIVNKQTGFLVEKDFDPETVASLLVEMRNVDRFGPAFRKGVRDYWAENYDANQNYFSFVKEIQA